MADIEQAIQKGIAYLASQQEHWDVYCEVGTSGFAVTLLAYRACKHGMSPLDPVFLYHQEYADGLNNIFANAHIQAIDNQSGGNPDSDGDGLGVYFSRCNTGYEMGIAMMGLASSRAPDRIVDVPGSAIDGWSYREVLQAAVDYCAWAQNECEEATGAWDYEPNTCRGDQSVVGYVVLGLAYAQSEYFLFDCIVPGFLKTELNEWTDYIQNDVDGDADDGGAGYTFPEQRCNSYKTGHILFQMKWLGEDPESQRVQDAVDYIERHWNDEGKDPGWRGPPLHIQAMYSIMKGFDFMGIGEIEVNGQLVDWYDEFADALLSVQLPNGAWTGDPHGYDGYDILSTIWGVLTLERVSLPSEFCDGKDNDADGLVDCVDPDVPDLDKDGFCDCDIGLTQTVDLMKGRSDIDFGWHCVGDKSCGDLIVSNTGTEDVTIVHVYTQCTVFAGSECRFFSIELLSPRDESLCAGKSLTLRICYDPNEDPPPQGFRWDRCWDAAIVYRLSGDPAYKLHELYLEGKRTRSGCFFSRMATEKLYGDVPVGFSETQTVTLANSGCEPLTVSEIISNRHEFVVISPSIPFVVPEYRSEDIVVQFLPFDVGEVNGALTLLSNAQNRDVRTGELIGDVTISVRGTCVESHLGDVNGDSEVNVLDIVLIVSFVLSDVLPTGTQIMAADVDRNGVVNIIDAVGLINMMLGAGR